MSYTPVSTFQPSILSSCWRMAGSGVCVASGLSARRVLARINLEECKQRDLPFLKAAGTLAFSHESLFPCALFAFDALSTYTWLIGTARQHTYTRARPGLQRVRSQRCSVYDVCIHFHTMSRPTAACTTEFRSAGPQNNGHRACGGTCGMHHGANWPQTP
ncbi:hypothetical protein K437DRAFT_104353 [Tilletiaria anomala UBC 951]|uniref:Uncharacterized protein n=1 Tax=Tilletiaria anomala (strain ATCC 24038 / CBS 436.72 / UBC 951) TaxID=1037660 RepID=A0A066VZ98_TILAU|nr:uncharacterized protein K437DRAFT_104353 [Tilletiaria anomala UBC 951]KDN46801.1 hypothetical protein K437DRAFT_104353 [Tilletiaria anomala UBC 951]